MRHLAEAAESWQPPQTGVRRGHAHCLFFFILVSMKTCFSVYLHTPPAPQKKQVTFTSPKRPTSCFVSDKRIYHPLDSSGAAASLHPPTDLENICLCYSVFHAHQTSQETITCGSFSSQPSFLLTYFSIPNSPAYLGLGQCGEGFCRGTSLPDDVTRNVGRENSILLMRLAVYTSDILTNWGARLPPASTTLHTRAVLTSTSALYG